MYYEIKNGTLSLGGNEILSEFNFRMVDYEKIGIVGRNGAGKTTLLRFIMGEISLDYNKDDKKGEVVKSKETKFGYLSQKLEGEEKYIDIKFEEYKNDNKTVYNYLLSAFSELIEAENKIELLTEELKENYDEKKAIELNKLIDFYNINGGNTYIKELKNGFKKFGFKDEELNRILKDFSGGQITKISLLRLLLSSPDVLVLDEPTNHLDIEAIEWMENYLNKYKGNVLIVSHDRMFLDNVCNVIYDIENKKAERYEGNYTSFLEQKEINYKLKMAEYNKNMKEIERLTALADRFRYKATKAKMVQSKDKIIDKMKDNLDKPIGADNKKINTKINVLKSGGKEVLRCTNLLVGYKKSEEIKNEIAKINMILLRKDRLGIIGPNGVGKSTFVKTIVGDIEKLSGEYSYGHEITFEYFDQKNAENNSAKTLFDDFSDEFPNYTNEDVRNRLGRFLFEEEDISKKVCDLSGGEKVRLALAKIFERKPNLLILDEPTNHLDILGKESLEKILSEYEGTIIFVSHDRYFVKKLSNKILYFEKRENEKEVATMFFEFGFEDYEKYLVEKESNFVNSNTNYEATKIIIEENNIIENKKSSSKETFELNKQKNKNEKKAKKIEKQIEEKEKKLEELQKEMEKDENISNYEEVIKIQKNIDLINEEIEKLYEEWYS